MTRREETPPATVRVLVINESAAEFTLFRDLLRHTNDTHYTVSWVSDADKGIAELSRKVHDVCLLDHAIEPDGGIVVLQEARRRDVRQPIIMLTGTADRSLDRDALEAGASDYLTKGTFGSRLLERSIRYVLERSALQAELAGMVTRDALTGLANRSYFNEFLDGALARAERSGHNIGLLCIDLDRFKEVNDRLGHGAGDELLINVSKLLTRCLRRGDLVARLGGDEFAAVLDAVGDASNAAAVARKILDALQAETWPLAGDEIGIGASIGVSMFPAHARNSDPLVRAADTAMREAKLDGRNNYRHFRNHMQDRVERRAEIHRGLGAAIANEELSLCYQPQVVVTSSRIIGFEALLRWSPPGGPVSPAEFIPLAEESGLICPIGEWALETACRQFRQWQTDKLVSGGVTLAVNVSAQQLTRGHLLGVVERTLDKTGMDPRSLEIEITETSTMHDTSKAVDVLERIQALGVRIALDDFGTGYSSLNHLKRLPIQTLKIDRSFINDSMAEGPSAELVKGILTLARTLGLTTIAEGVETETQRQFLIANRCALMQGYLFYRPMPAHELEGVLQDADVHNRPNIELGGTQTSFRTVHSRHA